MKKKIKLTAVEEQDLLHFREEWYAVGASCGPTDRDATWQVITAMYAAIGKPPPLCIFLASPLSCVLAMGIITQLGGQLGGQLRGQLGDQLRGQLRNALWGSHESYWIAFYQFCVRIGVQYPAELAQKLGWRDTLARSCGWWFPYEHVCFVADRPVVQYVDEQRRLHCEDGPAMAFADGYVLYAWHGVRVLESIIEQPETITVEQIHAETNAEIRRVMIERFGWDRLMDAEGGTLIDADTEPTGAPGLRGLFRTTQGQVLVCCCASTGRTYYLETPPEVMTCKQAASWLANEDGELTLLART